ncbi:MAG TPA: LLM class flavin-dependent oxidoreductase [Thermoanaerobaculia bacterium]|nr:LLM class flavin-dependent oxidoreductase [Thermoanaerobaculia bacterium]
MRFGYWLPVFGGWLRNVEDEGMEASWRYVRDLAVRSEQIGFDITLIAELNLNDIKGVDAPSLDAWSTAAALAAVTRRLELMVAVRPNFHHPGLLAKEAANIDHISGGRVALNVVSSWWRDEAEQQGLPFDVHDARYARTEEWLRVIRGLWRERRFTHRGEFYRIENAIVEPKPVRIPPVYAGGESDAAKNLIARDADAYVMHGDPPERLAAKIADMRARRERLAPQAPPLIFGVAGFVICRPSVEQANRELARITDVRASAAGFANYQQWLAGTQLEQAMSVEEYSVSNRGLRTGLIGTPDLIAERLDALQHAGLDLTLLQFSPQAEEMDRFAGEVIPLLGHPRSRNVGVRSNELDQPRGVVAETRN